MRQSEGEQQCSNIVLVSGFRPPASGVWLGGQKNPLTGMAEGLESVLSRARSMKIGIIEWGKPALAGNSAWRE